jgi:hypothetical protein
LVNSGDRSFGHGGDSREKDINAVLVDGRWTERMKKPRTEKSVGFLAKGLGCTV